MKPLKGNPTLRLLRLVLRRFNRLELLIQNNSRPLPDDLIDTPAVRMLTRMSDRTLSRRRSDGTIPYVEYFNYLCREFLDILYKGATKCKTSVTNS